ncbi:MAG: NfeD family protein [Acidobacteriota bacterium]|nr:NfeD family protein [Acidobacteriota bacterium]
MEEFAWILWIVLGVILIVAETLTLGFVLLWFGIGALAAAFAGWLGLGFGGQFLIFAAVSIVLTVMSRTIFANLFEHKSENALKSGSDSLPGQIGTVVSASRGALQESAVKVFGSTWTAFPIDERKPLVEGEKVEVVYVKGSSIYVRRAGELPEWREES